jgi:hypothetical protein
MKSECEATQQTAPFMIHDLTPPPDDGRGRKEVGRRNSLWEWAKQAAFMIHDLTPSPTGG